MFATAVRFLAKKGKGRRAKGPAGVNIGYEGDLWSGTLKEIVKEKGPLTVASFWEHAQTTGLRSKRHMKMILKWMRGQNHVKLVCNHLGDRRSPTEKEFMYTYVVPRSERFTEQYEGDATAPAEGESVPVASDAPPTPAAGPTPHVEDQQPRQI
ncbi:unnamed protein product [Calypogeia fissa]